MADRRAAAWLPLLLLAAMTLGCCVRPLSAAAPRGLVGTASHQCPAAADISRGARQLCSGSPVTDSLRLVGLHGNVGNPDGEHAAAAALLRKHGFQTALDLRLLESAGPEATELMEQLRLQGISIGARSKLRLLLGDERSPTTESDEARHAADAICTRGVEEGHGVTPGRQLQDVSGGISADAAAIVLSVLVGAAGYVLQAFTARRAEQVAAEQAQERHVAEQNRQRSHEQMLAQIQRTDRWLDDCCQPIVEDLMTINTARTKIIERLVFDFEDTYGDVVQHLLSFTATAYPIDVDGRVVSDKTKLCKWEPPSKAQLTRTFGDISHPAPSAAGVAISIQDMYVMLSAPLGRELPDAILKIIAAEPNGAPAAAFRHWCKTVFVPVCSRVMRTLTAHQAVIEWPSTAWLSQRFPLVAWRTTGSSAFGFYWAACERFRGSKCCTASKLLQYWLMLIGATADTMEFESLLEQWSEGDHADVHPVAACPLGGLLQVISHSRQAGISKQSELIGMSVAAELSDISWIASRHTEIVTESGTVAA